MPTPDIIREVLKEVYDPELNYNIVDLGLIYNVEVHDAGKVHVLVTLTTPACPIGPMLIEQIQEAAILVPGVKDVDVELTFEPPWDPSKMTDDAKAHLGID